MLQMRRERKAYHCESNILQDILSPNLQLFFEERQNFVMI